MNRSPPEASDNSRINEAVDKFNERVPLLGDGAALNERKDLHVIFGTSDEQAPLNKNEATSNEQGPLDGSCAASSEPTPPSDVKLQPVQATPSLKYEDLVIDDELYALGGAVGGSEIDTMCSSAEIDAIRRSTAELDAIYGSTAELDAIYGSTAELDEMCRSTRETDAIRRSKEEIDTIRRSKEEIDTIRHSKEEMGTIRRAKEEIGTIRRSKEERNVIRRLAAEIDTIRRSTAEMDAICRLEAEMDAKRRSAAEIYAIRRSAAERGEICRSTSEIDAIGHSTAEKYVVCGSTAAVRDAVGDSIKAGTDDNSRRADKVSSEVQADFDNMVKALFLSWQRFPPRRSKETDEFEFFTPKALQFLILTWRHIKTQRDVLPEPKIVVKGLTELIIDYFYLRNVKLPEDALAALRQTMTARITELVEEGWQKVLDGIEKEDQERERKRKERRRKFRKKMREERHILEVLRFYAPIAQLDNNPPMDFRRFGLLLCGYFSLFIYQIPIHTLLLSWPISIGVMGGLYMTQCPMSQLMPYVMMVLGAVGTVALLLRLSYVIYQAYTEIAISSWWPWIVLKFIEFLFLDCLIVQLIYFFSDTPNYVPGTAKYCNKTFYNFVHWINYVSIALVCFWIFAYFIKGLLWLRRRNFDYSYRRS